MTSYLAPEVSQTAFDGNASPSYSSDQRSETPNTPCTVDTWREADNPEPIAIVGLSLRFPGDATTVDSFWKILLEQRCTVTSFPEDRLSVSGNYHPDPSRRDTVSRVPAVCVMIDSIIIWS